MGGDTAGQARAQGPGAELSRERERQGLTQQQVADQLNLDVSVIHWIEHDDFAALGAPVFARGHLRRYSMLLGLPPERLLEAYEQAGTHPSQPTLIPRGRVELLPARAPHALAMGAGRNSGGASARGHGRLCRRALV